MPRLSLLAAHYRQVIGNYTYQQDNKYGDRRLQDERVKRLASTPGLHSENSHRQTLANATLQLFSLLSVASNSTASTAKVLNGSELPPVMPHRSAVVPQNVTSRLDMINHHARVVRSTTEVIPVFPETLIKKGEARTINRLTRHRQTSFVNDGKNNENLIHFLRKKGVVACSNKPCAVSKEQLVSGVAHRLFDMDIERGIVPLHSKATVARQILRASGDYGSQKREHLSPQQVDKVIRNWVFDTLLGMPFGEYLARKIATSADPGYYTVSSIKHLMALSSLDNEKRFNIENVPTAWRDDLEAMWSSLLRQELPLLDFTDDATDAMMLNSIEFSQLYTGTRFLSDMGQLREFSREESIQLGEALWRMALNEGISADKMAYFLLPALFFAAEKKPESINAEKSLHPLSADLINNYIESKKKDEVMRQRFIAQLERYQSAVDQWLSKGQLADKIIAGCPTRELPYLYDMADAIRTPQQKRERAERQSKQLYMNNLVKPCRIAPDSLQEEYQRLTRNVADCFSEIDKQLIGSVLKSMDESEVNFISSPGATVYPVSFSMKTDHAMIVAYNYAYDNNLYINLNKTDLFSVSLDGQERIYALKWETKNGISRYSIVRVDRDIQRYIEAGILAYHDFGSNGVIEGSKFKTDKDTYHFSISTDKKNPVGNGNDNIISHMSAVHRENLYQSLFTTGNDASDLQTLWKYVSHVIPFYDCIEGIVNNNPVQAVPSCLMDAVMIIPVFSQAASMASKFGMGLEKGINNARRILRVGENIGISQAFLKEISMPTLPELTSLGKNTLRGLDPGFELVSGIGKEFTKKVIAFLNKEQKTIALAEKLASQHRLDSLPTPSSSAVSARLPFTEVNMPVERIGREDHQGVYVMVNPDTGALAGKRFRLNHENQLIQIQNPNAVLQRLTPDPLIPELKSPYLLYNNLPRPAEFNQPPTNNPPGLGDVVEPINVPLLTDFLPTRFNNLIDSRVNVDFDYYRNHAVQLYFPHQWQDILAHDASGSHVYVHSMVDGLESIPEEFSFLREYLWYFTAATYEAIDISHAVRKKLYEVYFSNNEGRSGGDFAENIISDYMEEVLTIDTPEVIGIALERLKHYLDKICDYFENHPDKIFFATRKQTGIQNTASQGALGFTYSIDANRRIVLLVDRFINSEALNNAVHLTALHEASHVAGGTRDFYSSPYISRIGEPEEIPDAFEDQLTGRDQTNILQFDDDFLDAYAQRVAIQRPNIAQFKRLILNDDMLRANIIMDNADSLAKIIDDLYNRLFLLRRGRDVGQSAMQPNISKGMIKKALLSLTAALSDSGREA